MIQFPLQTISFERLKYAEGVQAFDAQFLVFLKKHHEALFDDLCAYRDKTSQFSPKAHAYFLIHLAQVSAQFLTDQFNIHAAVTRQSAELKAQDPIFAFKRYYVMRIARRRLKESYDFSTLAEALANKLSDTEDFELDLARYGVSLLEDKGRHEEAIELISQYCIAALNTDAGRKKTADWALFHLPEKQDFEHLIPLAQDDDARLSALTENFRARDGFDLTDHGMSQRAIQAEVDYCVYCHKNEGDYCRSGFPEKKGAEPGVVKSNPLGAALIGCPLDENISEMQYLRKLGDNLGALLLIMKENPMCVLTGHRICNDCMKSCIYQKQEPVNIPEVESAVLKDVLTLPWGVELYLLMTRWNPLRQSQYCLDPYNGSKVLVMGMGPAGISLAYHLLMSGCAVVGMDGLKIENLPEALLNNPILDYQSIVSPLSERVMRGFGGVAEYGITVRWDKNLLTLAYLALARHQYFQLFGGARFGGNVTVEKAWALGFDHLAIAVGAGLPKALNVPNSMLPGMRQANDFLMALQLTDGRHRAISSGIQIRLPALVIGGGLTGVDAATELQAYYIQQLDATLVAYNNAVKRQPEEAVRALFTNDELDVLDEFIAHARLVLAEREAAKVERREPNFISLLRQFGGVSIVYRKNIQASPAYRANHEELAKAMEEGIYYIECLQPIKAIRDESGALLAMNFDEMSLSESGQWQQTGQTKVLAARSILVATGASPNVAYSFEHRGVLNRVGTTYQSYQEESGKLLAVNNDINCKERPIGAFTSYDKEDKRVTFLGDTHPVFHGNVVKAITSGKLIYPDILAVLLHKKETHHEYDVFRQAMNNLLSVSVLAVSKISENVVRLIIKAPLQAMMHKPGQFYRLQTYETSVEGCSLEGGSSHSVALIGSRIASDPSCLSFVVFEKTSATKRLASMQIGERLNLMGPTGNGIHQPIEPGRVCWVGDEMAAVQCLSVISTYREAGCTVDFIANYADPSSTLFHQELTMQCDSFSVLASANDKVLSDALAAARPDTLWVIGDAALLAQIRTIRHSLPALSDTKCIASVYGPMQCMLKGVCAQCLQWQIDPETGKRTKAVYACSWQHQPLELVDLVHLKERCSGRNFLQMFSLASQEEG